MRSHLRWCAAPAVAIVLLVCVGAAWAGEPTGTTAVADAPQMIPEPNQGHAPRDAGERGGAAQLAVLAVVAGGLAIIVTLVMRESRRSTSR